MSRYQKVFLFLAFLISSITTYFGNQRITREQFR